ncbi:MAG: heme exporter protein CcmB, partial [Salinisphaera sp.]|nr:heme exporter protein CcmB [Salinisphaera sp.]
VVVKVAACWLTIGLPLTLAAPVLALQFDLSLQTAGWLALTLFLGTLALILITAVSGALVLEVRAAGALTALITLPLYVPVLVFGVGAVTAVAQGMNPTAAVSLLGACLALSLAFAPPAAAAALRAALE